MGVSDGEDEEAEERVKARAIRREMRRRRIDDYIKTRDWKRKEEEANPGSRGRFSNW